ncbi:hypothetical protein DPV78_004462 [Talaromyces pinophilus]|nr:hypothetical protein DPV78_004462 [Talaromyces pinophilus]
MPFAGKVDSCPCLSITFPGLQVLGCPTGGSKKGPGAGSLFDGLFHRQTEELFGMEDSYGHICTFKHHPATDMTIASVPKRDEVLKMSTTYVLKSKNQILRSGLRAVDIRTPLWLAGKHQNVKEWLQRLFCEAGSSFTGLRKAHSVGAYIARGVIHIDVKRDLGRGSWPDMVWMRNSVQV